MVAVLSHGLAKTNLKTKTSRAKLTPRSAVYAQTLSGGRALCYRIRRAGHPGRWLLRTAKPQGGYNMEVLGVADDITDADGTDVLTYAQALEATLGKVHADPTKITIERAMQDWADAKAAAASTPDRAPAYHYAARVLAAAFPGATLQSLTARQISQWHSADTRSSRASANRSLATLKAGLTRAADLAGYKGDRPWTAVKLHSKKSSFTARVTVMTEDEEERLIEAARPDLAQLLRALQMTGARMGEIREATVGDLHGNRLALTGKTGPRVITLSADKAAWFRKVAGNRKPESRLFLREDGIGWPAANYVRLVKRAVKRAGLENNITAYTLRHGFISRALARGVPVVAVGQHCGTSVAMIQNSYAKFVSDDMARWFE